MEATVNINGIWNLFSSLDMNRKDSFAKELSGLMSKYITPKEDKPEPKPTEDEITMQLLKDCYGALECWDDDFVEEIKYSRSFKTRDEKLMELWESYE